MPKERSEIEARYKWRLEDIFPSDEAWAESLTMLKGYLPAIRSYQGRLGEKGETLLAYLQLDDACNHLITDLINYAMRRNDEDTRVAAYQAMVAQLMAVLNQLSAVSSFEKGEILAIPEETLTRWYATVDGLALYRRRLDGVRRRKEHILSPEEERLLASAGELASAPDDIFSMLNDACFRFPDAVDKDGKQHPLTTGTYELCRKSADRVLRQSAYESLNGVYLQFQDALAATLAAQTKQLWFFAKARNYPSSLAAALDENEVPEEIYHNLIAAVHRHLPKLHRYISLRKKLLGLDELRSFDLYTPLVADADVSVSYEEAKKLVSEAVAPLGEEYVSIFKNGMEDGWIDVYENPGKRSGAYSAGANAHPYVLMNYQGGLQDVYTLIHEMGHSMHTWYTMHYQPECYRGYTIFVAEVASTCNEALLTHYLLSKTTDRKQRAYLVNYFLEQFRTTLFRQCQFAEFELAVNSITEAGDGVTAEACNRLYHQNLVDYFGPDLTLDKEADVEWARIPHFYYNYYVYQYSTGFTAAIALSQRILNGGEDAVQDYLDFLKGGCSKTPIDLLKGAGVDMSTTAPIDAAMEIFSSLLDQLEELV